MSFEQRWPDALWLVRHGESAGNVARAEAEAAGRPLVNVATRDVDVPLSDLGVRQAEALGRWFGARRPEERPNVVLSSPYLRARSTAERVIEAAGLSTADLEFVVDERLREREFGILDGLTGVGVRDRYPDQYELKQAIGKFYHRPPGGESWCDVILRLRSVVGTISRDYVVMCFRYLFDRMTEDKILSVDRVDDVANCSVTTYVYDPTLGAAGRMVLREFNFTAPLEDAGAAVTSRPDDPVAPK
jgi:broad specificity phosphatase PhoE